MAFVIKQETGLKDTEVWLEEDEFGIDLVTEHWVILRLTPEGTLVLESGIASNNTDGIAVDRDGRIVITND